MKRIDEFVDEIDELTKFQSALRSEMSGGSDRGATGFQKCVWFHRSLCSFLLAKQTDEFVDEISKCTTE